MKRVTVFGPQCACIYCIVCLLQCGYLNHVSLNNTDTFIKTNVLSGPTAVFGASLKLASTRCVTINAV